MSIHTSRRALLLAGLGQALPAHARPTAPLAFPRDHGAHLQQLSERWYLTGHASHGVAAAARIFGFQVTFFRSRVDHPPGKQSSLAARQLIFAHAAVTDVQGRKLWHDHRVARSSGSTPATEPGQASGARGNTALRLGDWSLLRNPANGRYAARIQTADFSLDLQLTSTQALLLQGQQGLSRRGANPAQFSHYYSQPQLAARGQLTLKGQAFDLAGSAWLDHEWSDALPDPRAVGRDGVGMNLFDGSTLTVFQLRDAGGQAIWDGGSFRHPRAGLFTFSQGAALFQAVRGWKSPISGTTYPVEWVIRTPADFYTVKAVIEAQELDSRQSSGAIDWIGLSDLFDSNGKHVGRGYLEMTGYAKPLRL